MEQQKRKELINAKDIWAMIKKRKWLLIIPSLLTFAAVFVGAQFLTPVYQAWTIVSVNREVRLSSDIQGLLGIARNYRLSGDVQQDELRAYYNEITSASFLFQLSDRMKLDTDPDVVRKVQRIQASAPSLTAEQARLYVLQDRIGAGIMVKNAGANQISISSESTSPTEARDIANILGELFVAELLKQEVASVRSSQDFTDVQLEKYEKLLQDKIDEKTSFERRLLQNRLDTAVVSETNRNQIQSEVDQTEEDITDYQNEEKTLLARLNSKSPRLPAASLALRDSKQNQQNKDALKNQLQTMNDLLQRYAWSDAQAMNYRLKQSSLLSLIESENKKLVAEQFAQTDDDTKSTLARLFTVRANADFLATKIQYLNSTLTAIKDRISRIPEYQATMDRLNRDIFNATELRDKFKKQQEGSTISQALLANMSTSKYRIVEPATLPLVPVRPDRLKVYLLGIVLGLAIGTAVLVLAEVFDSSFKKLQDVEDTLGLPVLGLVPKMQFVAYLKKQMK